MPDINQQINQVVWFDLPVADLDRAMNFYNKVLDIEVIKQSFGEVEFAVLAHDKGNGGCLVVQPENVGTLGPLIYLNVEGRIQQATTLVSMLGGDVTENIHSIGPHGFRALIVDSEGNRVALHSSSDE